VNGLRVFYPPLRFEGAEGLVVFVEERPPGGREGGREGGKEGGRDGLRNKKEVKLLVCLDLGRDVG
jgi:hypothetical protein